MFINLNVSLIQFVLLELVIYFNKLKLYLNI